MCDKAINKRSKDAAQALNALMAKCAKGEVCVYDARRLMARWGVPASDFEGVIEKLIKEKFIDEQRYADAFVRDKLNFSRWGARKISDALYAKRIPPQIISKAMEQIEKGSLREKLETDLAKKMKSLKEEDKYKLRDKLIRFGISRGFDYETVAETANRLMSVDE